MLKYWNNEVSRLQAHYVEKLDLTYSIWIQLILPEEHLEKIDDNVIHEIIQRID